MLKKSVCIFMALVLVFAFTLPVLAAPEGIIWENRQPVTVRIFVDGEEIIFPDAKPFIDANSRTQVTFRPVAEMIGYDVDWNKANWKADPKVWVKGKRNIELKIGEKFLTCDGQRIDLDTAALIKNDRTFIPLRGVCESLGYALYWDNEKKQAGVYSEAYLAEHPDIKAKIEEQLQSPVEEKDTVETINGFTVYNKDKHNVKYSLIRPEGTCPIISLNMANKEGLEDVRKLIVASYGEEVAQKVIAKAAAIRPGWPERHEFDLGNNQYIVVGSIGYDGLLFNFLKY